MKNTKGFNLISVILIIVVVAVIAGVTTGIIMTNSYRTVTTDDEALNEFLRVYNELVDSYYEDVDKTQMLNKAKDAMLDYLGDPYTTYLNSEERKALEDRLNGTYKGIGVSFVDKTIVDVMKDTPASKAGLQKGDVFVKIDNKLVESLSDTQISNLIKNSGKDVVKVVVLRGEEEKEFTIEVKTVTEKVVVSEKIKDTNIGYISVPIFSKTISQQVEEALLELEKDGIESLILDLRDDSGGYLDQAQNLASLFLEKGKLIYSLENKNARDDYFDQTDTKREYDIVILINGNSASAAEILAAALKDSYGATLVGTKSYGKGKVQQTFTLSDGSMAKYTSAKWFRPDGTCIDEVGITPDYVVNLEPLLDDNGEQIGNIDTQLEKGIDILSNTD